MVSSSDQTFHTATLFKSWESIIKHYLRIFCCEGINWCSFLTALYQWCADSWHCTSGVLTAGTVDNKGGHELTTDVGRDIGPGTCEVVDLTSTVTRNGRLTGRLLPGGLCGGGLKVTPELNTACSECGEATSQDTLDMVVDTTGK